MNITLPSPAKLNLFLHIVGRRPDGYHELQTLFQLLDHGDQLTFEVTAAPEIILPNTFGVPPEQNLIYKAAKSFQAYTGCHQGAIIHVEKCLPIGGGIGGGSSNAATTLLALNYLWETRLSIDQLAELGKALGADVPVFVRGHTAWAEGIGEVLTPLTLPEAWYLVITPNCSVATARIYGHTGLTRDTSHITIAQFLAGDPTHNDLETVVRELYPQVDHAINWLSQFAEAKMTGSGASVFAKCLDMAQAQEILAQLPLGFTGFLAQGLNRSPLHQALDKIANASVA